MKIFAVVLLFVGVCTVSAQNSCKATCSSKYPNANQASQLNSCNAACSPPAAPARTTSSSSTTPAAANNGWNMNTAQRQIAVQNAEVQQSAQQLNNARVDEIHAQMDQMQAQQAANAAAGDAAQAGLQTGVLQGTYAAGRANYDKRVDMVRDAFNGPKPKTYTNRSSAVTLADPFAEAPSKVDEGAYAASLTQACMEMGDKDHPVAKIAASCKSPSVCRKMPVVGMYPVLQDGRMIDSQETLGVFLKACADPALPMAAMTEDGVTVEVH